MKVIVFDAVNAPLRLAELAVSKPSQARPGQARAMGRPMECEDFLMLGQPNDTAKC